MDMHVEIARLWQEENPDRTIRALPEALRISQASEQVDPRLLNNLSVLQHLEGNLDEARTMYGDALTKAASLSADTGEAMSTSILYNLVRVYEDRSDVVMAQEAYDKVVARHSDYVNGWFSRYVP